MKRILTALTILIATACGDTDDPADIEEAAERNIQRDAPSGFAHVCELRGSQLPSGYWFVRDGVEWVTHCQASQQCGEDSRRACGELGARGDGWDNVWSS